MENSALLVKNRRMRKMCLSFTGVLWLGITQSVDFVYISSPYRKKTAIISYSSIGDTVLLILFPYNS